MTGDVWAAELAAAVGPAMPAAASSWENWAALGGIIILALGGWNLLIQRRFKDLDDLASWRETFIKEYAKDRLDDSTKYATKADMETGLKDVKASVTALGDKIDRALEFVYKGGGG